MPQAPQPSRFHKVRNHWCCAGPRFILWILLVFGLALTIGLLVPRYPSFAVENVAFTSAALTSLTSASILLSLDLIIDNTNFYAIHVSRLSFNAYHPLYAYGTQPFASAHNVSAFWLPMRASTSLAIPFAVAYDLHQDANLAFAKAVAGACAAGLIAGHAAGGGLPVKVDASVDASALGVGITWGTSVEQNVACPKVFK